MRRIQKDLIQQKLRTAIRLFSSLTVAAFAAGAMAAGVEYKDGEVLVKFKDDASRPRVMMNAMYESLGAVKVKRFSGTMKGMEQIFLNPSVKVMDAVAELQRSELVEFAQPNYILRTQPITKQDGEDPGMPGGVPCIPGFDIPGCDKDAPIPCLIPGFPFPPGCTDDPGNPGNPGNPVTKPELQPAPGEVNPPVADTDLSKAYGIAKIGAPEAWALHKGNKNFVVAVIDTGIDYNHEDLSFNVWRNPNPGEKKDVTGYDFIHDDGMPFDDNDHGTHCSGTIGAVGGNGVGVSGVNQRVSIMGLKFLSAEGSGSTADAIKAIDYAITHGAKVLSNSWGGKGDDGNAALKEAIDRARAKDVLFVAAAGNDGTDNDGRDPSFPAAFDNDNLIAVAATNSSDQMASFSNYGKKTTHLGAPGVNVYSLKPGNKYQSLSGTSMACPHVAGAAALLWSKHPEWNYKKVKEVLLSSVDPVSSLSGKTVTGGRLNILKALRSTE